MIHLAPIDLSSADVTTVYADGGCVGKNPSAAGGTWAFALAGSDDEHVIRVSGSFTTEEVGFATVDNNLSETVALLIALEQMPDGWGGLVVSDSLNAIRRVIAPGTQKFSLCPQSVIDRCHANRGRLGELSVLLVAGHPSKKQLAAGVKNGRPVRAHQAWCDRECKRQARAVADEIAAKAFQIPPR